MIFSLEFFPTYAILLGYKFMRGVPMARYSVRAELLGEAFSWGKTILFAVVFALLINRFVIVNATVPSGSMESTIQTNDRIIAFRLSYLFSDPNLFDIIVFPNPHDPATLNVKRVVGMPGDTVNIIDGHVFLNNEYEPLRYDFVQGLIFGNFGPYEVPEGHFFVLGDYRSNSIDSRHWNTSNFVYGRDVLGRVIFRYFPRFGILTNT